MAANTEKSVSLTDSDVQTFWEGKEKPKVTAFLAAESENRRLEDLPWADGAIYQKDFFCR